MKPKLRITALTLALGVAAGCASAADKVKVGFLTTLSGPGGALGVDIRDAFMLAVKLAGGKLGDLPAEVIVSRRPAEARRRQAAGREAHQARQGRLHDRRGVLQHAAAALPAALDSEDVLHQPEHRPSTIRGREVQSELLRRRPGRTRTYHGRAGKYANQSGIKNVYLIAPNYPAGKESLAGFKRYFKGKIADEVYTKLGQLDYAAELAEIRAASRRRSSSSCRAAWASTSSSSSSAPAPNKDDHAAAAGLLGRRGHDQAGRRRDRRRAQLVALGARPRQPQPTDASSPTSRRSTAGCRACTRRRATTRGS